MRTEVPLLVGTQDRAYEQHCRTGSPHKRRKHVAYGKKYGIGAWRCLNIATQMYAARNDEQRGEQNDKR